MRSTIVEAHHEGLWLKATVATFDEAETSRPCMVPGYETPSLMRTIGTVEKDDVWILDWSTREGAAFSLDRNPFFQLQKIQANL